MLKKYNIFLIVLLPIPSVQRKGTLISQTHVSAVMLAQFRNSIIYIASNMPSNLQLFRKYNYNPIFIETGSYAGDGIKNAIFSGFKEIYSIELAERYHDYCKDYFKYNVNVHLLKGDSVLELPKIMASVNAPSTFWLDAHYSGGDTDFANILSPLMKELDIIGSHHIKTHTILVDDLREWQEWYPAIGFGLNQIKEKILSINPNYMFYYADGERLNDILVAEIRRVKPINITVFSKDRAMQLDLFIRSFNKYVKDSALFNINVLYTASSDRFEEGYKLMSKYPNVVFIREVNFKADTLNLVNATYPHTVFFVDDDIFKENFDFYDSQMDLFNVDGSIACRSLRLSYYLEYCYTMQIPMKQPVYTANNRFNWENEKGDFGYPMALDGHIFRTGELFPFLQELEYSNPNTLESVLVHKRMNFGKNMICYDKAPIVNNPINRVQTVNNNICGNITATELNDKFLDGYIIDLTPFDGMLNKACHQEVTPTFIKA